MENETFAQKRERLKGMLEAVQDLKSQYYIGTQQAWDYINAEYVAERNAQRVADEVNKRLPSHFPCKATPATLLYLIEMGERSASEKVESANVTFTAEDLENLPPEHFYFYRLNCPYDLFFNIANLLNPHDEDLGREIDGVDILAKGFVSLYVASGILERDGHENPLKCDTHLNSHYGDSKRETIGIRRGEIVNSDQIAHRVANDQVVYRIEYARQIAQLYAEEVGARSGHEAHEIANKSVAKSIALDDKRKAAAMDGATPMTNAIENFFNSTGRGTKTRKLILNAVARESRWLDKVLTA